MKITDQKILFDPALQAEIKDRFYYVNEDYLGRKRQFFENSGTRTRYLHDAQADQGERYA